LILDDEDLKLMTNVFENKQRLPIEVIKAKFIDLNRKYPS